MSVDEVRKKFESALETQETKEVLTTPSKSYWKTIVVTLVVSVLVSVVYKIYLNDFFTKESGVQDNTYNGLRILDDEDNDPLFQKF